MRTVEVTNQNSIRHRVTFDDGDNAIRVDTLVRNTNGTTEFWTRKLWEKGDPKLSLAAHCAINAARRAHGQTLNATEVK